MKYLLTSCYCSLFKPQQAFDEVQVCRSDFALLGHYAFALLGFLCKDVTFEGFLEGDLTRAGYFKTLLGT